MCCKAQIICIHVQPLRNAAYCTAQSNAGQQFKLLQLYIGATMTIKEMGKALLKDKHS